MNKVFISGNLTKDVEIRYTNNGKAMAKSGIAVTSAFKNSDGERGTDFFNLIAWGKTAEFFGKYLHKGSKILVEGRLKNNHYTDKNGNKQYTEDIWVDTVEFAGGKPANKFDDNFDGDNVPDDDVPF